MGFFSGPQLALASGRSVIYDELYKLDFTSGAGYYWTGFGNVVIDGFTWLGAGNLVSRSEIPFGIDDEAGDLTLTLSGVDATVLNMVRAEEAEIYGRDITIWGQFFDEALQPSGSKWQIFRGIMDVPTYGVGSFGERAITIPCEGEWTDRNTARNSLFSDMDQKRRYPGDLGLEYVYRYTLGVKRVWPTFD
jgi:hypothetical protein